MNSLELDGNKDAQSMEWANAIQKTTIGLATQSKQNLELPLTPGKTYEKEKDKDLVQGKGSIGRLANLLVNETGAPKYSALTIEFPGPGERMPRPVAPKAGEVDFEKKQAKFKEEFKAYAVSVQARKEGRDGAPLDDVLAEEYYQAYRPMLYQALGAKLQ